MPFEQNPCLARSPEGIDLARLEGMAQDPTQEILERLTRADPLGIGAVRWQASRLEARRYSSIWILQAVDRPAGEVPDLVLKLYHAAAPERRQQEYDDLGRVWSALGPDAGIVRPVACWADRGAVITTRADGVPLARLAREACRHGAGGATLAQAAALCTAAGTWLRGFQARGVAAMRGTRPRHLDGPDAFLAYLDERLRILRDMRAGIDPALHSRLVAYAATALHAVPRAEWDSITWSHSDFGPHNLLATGERVVVLDFELAPQHPAFDAAYFVESLTHAAGGNADASHVRRLARAFLSGWGGTSDSTLFALLRFRHVTCSFVSESRRGGIAQLRAWSGLRAMRRRLESVPAQLAPRRGARAA